MISGEGERDSGRGDALECSVRVGVWTQTQIGNRKPFSIDFPPSMQILFLCSQPCLFIAMLSISFQEREAVCEHNLFNSSEVKAKGTNLEEKPGDTDSHNVGCSFLYLVQETRPFLFSHFTVDKTNNHWG